MGRSERKFTKVLAGAVAAVGLFSTILLLTDPPSAAETDTYAEVGPTVFELNTTKLKVLSQSMTDTTVRKPASADFMTSGSQAIVALNCDKAKPELNTNEIRIRLKGFDCIGDSEKPSSTSIKNKTNGFIATVFHKSDATFTTDYINLIEGENRIAINFESNDKTLTQEIIVHRAPASLSREKIPSESLDVD